MGYFLATGFCGKLTKMSSANVLALRFGEQLTAREVAEIMGKNVGAVEVQQHRALAALRRILEKE